jgi:18S rRNA (guanine1575-N7)-methyltransferase
MCALRCGFTGGMVIDFPNSAKAKKYFLCLFAGQSDTNTLPQALGTTPVDIDDNDNDDDNDDNDDNDNDDNDDGVSVASAAVSGVGRTLRANAAAFSSAVQASSSSASSRRKPHRGKRKNIKDVDWVLRKKERARARGNTVVSDSKYTGRKRRAAF